MAECAACTRPTDLRLCAGCLDQLKSELKAIPWLVRELDTTLTRQARVGERNGPRSSEVPLPYHAGASVDLETIRDTLSMWADAIASARGISVDADKDSIELSRWLLRWAGEVARHADAAELLENVVSMTKAGRRTIDLAPDRKFLGPCDSCNEDLYVWSSGSGKLPERVTCPNPDCAETYPMKERRIWILERAYNQLLSASELTQALGQLVPGQSKQLNASTIRTWASRGLRGRTLTAYLPHPKDPKQRPRYLVEEVIEFARLAMESTSKPAS